MENKQKMENTNNKVDSGNSGNSVQAKASPLAKYSGKFILKPCKKTWLEQIDPKHDGAKLFSDAKVYLAPDIDNSTGLIKTGMTDDEARALEEKMGLKSQSLSPYNKTFWANFKIYPQIPQVGIILDLDRSPMDILRYLYCKVHSRVAQSLTDASENPQSEFVLTSTEKEAKTESLKIKVKIDAMKVFGEMTFNKQMDFLKVYEEGRFKVSKSSTADYVMSVVGKIVDEHPQKFLDTMNNPHFTNMCFLSDCIIAGLIKKSGPKYYITGGDLLGQTYLDAVQNLDKPEYNETKVSLLAKLEKSK